MFAEKNVYADLADELRKAMRQIMDKKRVPEELAVCGQKFVPWLQILFAAEARTRHMAEDAVIHYAKYGELPEVDAVTRHFTGLRLLYAAHYVSQLATLVDSPQTDAGNTDHKAHLIWFSIYHWNAQYDVSLKSHAVSLYFSLPFFGL